MGLVHKTNTGGCNPWLIKLAAASTSSLCFTHSLENRVGLASVTPSVSTPMCDSAEERISGERCYPSI